MVCYCDLETPKNEEALVRVRLGKSKTRITKTISSSCVLVEYLYRCTDSVHISLVSQSVNNTTTNSRMVYEELAAVCCEDQMKNNF